MEWYHALVLLPLAGCYFLLRKWPLSRPKAFVYSCVYCVLTYGATKMVLWGIDRWIAW